MNKLNDGEVTDYIVPLCQTLAHNRTFDGFVDNKPHFFMIDYPQNEVEFWFTLASFLLKGRTRSLFWPTATRRKA